MKTTPTTLESKGIRLERQDQWTSCKPKSVMQDNVGLVLVVTRITFTLKVLLYCAPARSYFADFKMG